ncbi:hypothetical protein ACODM8_16835 [Vibrio ostreicida]|uniref:Chemotaxis protein n=1 Tax=Vibrio ostreicida TaxID=526588 RepID=A0ABT8C108_9VIBR|nr:hypothetical protein [Vibrio ostreicida]MDN3612023.1 hypothetical protein [Vibrio ostreicida]NPD08804.1 hypothetical protein [Vibrio ostreicida]
MSDINLGLSRPVNTLDSGTEAAKTIVENSPIIQRAIDATETSTSSKYLFTPGFSDPLDLIDQLLSKYIEDQTAKADKMAEEIEVKSSAIAEINRLWGLTMSETLPYTDPNNNDKTTLSSTQLEEIDRLIREDLGEPDGIKMITGSNLEDSEKLQVSYGTLQEYNATMTAYCDTVQVDLDTMQQEFKNTMTEISSAQEEIRDVRRAIVAITQG